MGVVTVSSSAARSPVGLNKMYLTRASLFKMPVILSFKNDESKNTALVVSRESVNLPLESKKENGKRLRKVRKRVERINAVKTDEASPSTLELDYSEAAAKLENIYKGRSATVEFDEEVKTQRRKRRESRRKRTGETEEIEEKSSENVVRSKRKGKRLNLEKRIALRMKKEGELVASSQKKKHNENDDDEKIDRLVRDYSASSDFVSLDWKKMKIPPVLPSSEHVWLFKLMQPMKEIV
ncbi:hypothetical protein CDL12_00097 [Handroanthus impetiginosus]|uniref:Uncharacterized protein n=1 Tax=Handroanthus impetiginosus TaxID=429701 RepID=A0A2G9IBK3_9LAMI|nr:hypothetical protein CDL12_00097 [Handroanthus impetiginosus]